jgi:hypothetical protein
MDDTASIWIPPGYISLSEFIAQSGSVEAARNALYLGQRAAFYRDYRYNDITSINAKDWGKELADEWLESGNWKVVAKSDKLRQILIALDSPDLPIDHGTENAKLQERPLPVVKAETKQLTGTPNKYDWEGAYIDLAVMIATERVDPADMRQIEIIKRMSDWFTSNELEPPRIPSSRKRLNGFKRPCARSRPENRSPNPSTE